MISTLLYQLNHAPLWRREITVWDQRMRAASLDRLVALGLHRLGWMGLNEAILLQGLIRPGMQVVDVGANVGLYSLLLARMADESGSVFAFEPEPNLFAILRENCLTNGATNVFPFQCALGGRSETTLFHRSAFNSGDNRLGRASVGHDPVEIRVERFDDLLPDCRPDFVKIDVQGHELAVLTGMEHALASNLNVRVLFEFSPRGLRNADTAPELLLNFFFDRGFELYETEGACLRKMQNTRQLISDLRGSRYTNLLAARGAVEIDD